jgi:hypothetical protein
MFETFLYKLVFSTLRSDNRSKIDSLGAFCYLLQLHSQSTEHLLEHIVHCDMTLTNAMIDEYRTDVRTKIQWLALTSTSKDRVVAEAYVIVMHCLSFC